jgi:hypothetical protein
LRATARCSPEVAFSIAQTTLNGCRTIKRATQRRP